jgi:hypothetical protein
MTYLALFEGTFLKRIILFLVYLDVSPTGTNTGTVAFTFSATTSTIRTWEIKVTQIECSNTGRYSTIP